ncbi:cell surface protein [Listeria monocytogenes]|uniref:LPXTG cell wall anchor domain-containing protein n=2 Tax=Listeria monocytogenes TaxID=1639 RepID=A0A823J7D7_LISMN|nr:MucBP domain-containing protein [Listeria monocytogenes]EAG9222599.1 LPXTG cell wall anchor domain-containing protein [Listeria monocytogenes]EAG9354686.1 LPXTG cell wall anchor domain-containing protein [Listeria monocytogenes]OET16368.1 cell surface protein [Listeria monocytogenes]OFG91327.1 cell surface protein [Listeria monocytogenes]RFQ29166.1 cell surface protein [Listeria monocytogenes]
MQKIIKIMLVLFLMTTLFLPFSNARAASTDVVNIPDSYLKEGLKTIVGNPFLTELTEANLETITIADISYMYSSPGYAVTGLIRDLTGLEKAVNMTKLYFSNQTAITNLNQIKNLPNLKKIVGVTTGLNDIKALSEMPALEEVELGGDYITDFSPLLEKENLKSFSYNSYAWLDPAYHQINNEEFEKFANLKSLENLDVTWNNITDLAALTANDHIKNLNLSYNKFTNVAPIATMKELKVLYLNNNNLTSIDSLNTLRGLSIAYADNNNITDLSKLKDFFEGMDVVGDYKGLQVNNQTITLPTINIKEGATAISNNPTLDIDGEKMPVSSISDGGTVSTDNKTVSFANLPVGNKTVTYKATFTATSAKGVPLSYSLKVSQPITVSEKTDSTVNVFYKDENGNELATSETISGKSGENYQTIEKTITNYKLKEIEGQASGQFSDSDATVTYVYEKADGAPVTVKYVDGDGNELATSDTLNGKIDATYQSTAKSITGWTVKTTPTNANGIFTNTNQTVTYVYEKANGAPVTVKYVDGDGNELATSDTLNGKIDAPYQSTAKSITGWTVKTTPANANGVFTNTNQTVTYVYEKADGAPVTVKYVDGDGNELATSDTLNGKIDAPYQSTAKSITGWTVKRTPTNANGVFTNANQTVTYVYEKADGAPVTVKYVDGDGNDLATSDTLNGKIDAPYQTTAKSLSGWTIKTTPTNANGIFTNTNQTVTYVYEKADGASVTVKYVDGDGNELATPDTLNGKIDAPYQSTAKSLSGWTIKTTPTNATGVFTNSNQTVTYVYEKADGAPVTVKYVDADGNELATPDTLNGKLDTSYTATAKNLSGWKLTATPANANGVFTNDNQTVTFVYAKQEDDPKKEDTTPSNTKPDKNKTAIKINENKPKASKVTTIKKQTTLPKTGDNQQDSILFGLIGTCFVLLGIYSISKKNS